MTISLEEFIKYLVSKWKIIILAVILNAAVFLSAAALLGEEISVPHSEEYLYYEDALERHLVYVEESALMTLNPNSIYERTIFVDNITNKTMLNDYIVSLEIWDDLNTERTKKYLPELLTWNEIEEKVEIVLRQGSSAECEEWTNYIAAKIKDFDQKAEVTIGVERIVADEDVELEQLRRYTRTEHIKSLWLESQAGYSIKISKAAAVVLGCFAGGILGIIVSLIQFVMDKGRGKHVENVKNNSN